MVEIGADVWLVCVTKDAFERAICSGFNDGGVDFFDCCGARGLECEVNNRDVWCGHADSDAVEFAVQFWQHEANSLSRTR